MSIKEQIKGKLATAFPDATIDIVDDSAKHAGHLLHPGGVEDRGETHFTVKIVAPAFSGKRLVERHRMINGVLAEELAGPVHALAIKAQAPGE